MYIPSNSNAKYQVVCSVSKLRNSRTTLRPVLNVVLTLKKFCSSCKSVNGIMIIGLGTFIFDGKTFEHCFRKIAKKMKTKRKITDNAIKVPNVSVCEVAEKMLLKLTK